MKKLSTTRFYNSSRSISLVLVISSSEVIWRIWISNGRKFNHNFSWVNDFNLKSCQLQIWTTFWGLQHLFWVFRHPRLFENSNFKWFQMKKLSTTKLHNFSRSTNFVLDASTSEILKYHYTLYNYGTYVFSWY